MRGAFSLIEVIVVFAIIVVLTAMISIGVSVVKRAADVVSCGNNLRQVYLGVMSYISDNAGVVPPSRRVAWQSLDPLGWHAWNWRGAVEIGGYLGNGNYGGAGQSVRSMGCPVQQRAHPVSAVFLFGNPVNTSGYATYGMNVCLTSAAIAPVQPDAGTNFASIGNPSSVFMIGDGVWVVNNYGVSVLPFSGGMEFPHQKRISITYCDGHIKSLSAGECEALSSAWNVVGSSGREFWLGNL